MFSLFFDTIVIDNHSYDSDSISRTFENFSTYGIQNFIFLVDFDFTKHPISFQKEKIESLKSKLANLRYRGIRTYVFNNLAFDKGVTFNKNLPKIYASRKSQSLFLDLDLKSSIDYNVLAQDINRLIYTKKTFPIFSNFDSIIEYSQQTEYKKLLSNQNFGFAFDLNYLFAPEKSNILSKIIESHSMILPTISNSVSNYISCIKDAEFLVQRIGKQNYSALCYQIQRCSSKALD